MYCDLHTHTKHTVLLGAVSWLLIFFMLWLKESVMHSSETTLVLSSSGNSLTNHISSSDNKSVSHWIMFDYFFHVWKVNMFFFLIMFLGLFFLTCVKFYGKKIDNNYILTDICLPPFFQMASYDLHKVGQSSIKHMILS